MSPSWRRSVFWIADALGDRRAALFVDIGYHHPCAGVGKRLDDRFADQGRPAGDDGHLSRQNPACALPRVVFLPE
jgi:hypothetical protein